VVINVVRRLATATDPFLRIRKKHEPRRLKFLVAIGKAEPDGKSAKV
jgi:hypothetical protein